MGVFSLSNNPSNTGNTPVTGHSATGVLSRTIEHPQKAQISAETRVLPTCFRPDGNTTPSLKKGVCCRLPFSGRFPLLWMELPPPFTGARASGQDEQN